MAKASETPYLQPQSDEHLHCLSRALLVKLEYEVIRNPGPYHTCCRNRVSALYNSGAD